MPAGDLDLEGARADVKAAVDALWNGTASERNIIEELIGVVGKLGEPDWRPRTPEGYAANMTIHVALEPGLTPEDVTVSVTGSEDHLLTEDVIKDAWGIEDVAALARDWLHANGYHGARVDSVRVNASSLHEPGALSGNGVANTLIYNVDPRVRLTAHGGRLVEIQTELVLADHALWDNRGNPDKRHFAATMGVTSSSSVESSWTRSQKLGITTEIGVSIGPVDAKTSLTYETEWGESHGESHGEDVSFSNEIKGELEPGELQVAALSQQRGFAIIDSDYVFEPVPEGLQYVGFTGRVGGHDSAGPWSYGRFVIVLDHLLGHAGKPLQVRNTLRDKCGVFADADLKSYPIPVETTEDEIPEAIDKAVGRHELRTTYHAPAAA